MAIVKFSGGIPPPSSSAGAMLTTGAQGSPVMIPTTTNRAKTGRGTVPGALAPTPAFTALDNQILHLDAVYDSLPNQADWETYAANINGDWSLCANCELVLGGKKLFRQYNMNRQAIGLAVVTVPVLNTEYSETRVDGFDWFGPGIGNSWFCVGGIIPVPDIEWLQFQMGRVQANELVAVTPANSVGSITAGPLFQALQAVALFLSTGGAIPANTFLTIPACQFTDTGAPGVKQGIGMSFFSSWP
jgi:hypothetical protein